MALAVGSAPEPGGAVLAARQQALPVGAQAQPVDASLVIRADLHGGATVPHPEGGGCGSRSQVLRDLQTPLQASSHRPPTSFGHYLSAQKSAGSSRLLQRGHEAGRGGHVKSFNLFQGCITFSVRVCRSH